MLNVTEHAVLVRLVDSVLYAVTSSYVALNLAPQNVPIFDRARNSFTPIVLSPKLFRLQLLAKYLVELLTLHRS